MNKLTSHRLTSSGARQPRRAFLQQSVAGAVAATTILGGQGASVHAADRYGYLESDKYLGPVDVLAKIKDREVFTEGPAVARLGRVFFTNVPMES